MTWQLGLILVVPVALAMIGASWLLAWLISRIVR